MLTNEKNEEKRVQLKRLDVFSGFDKSFIPDSNSLL